MSSQSKEVLSLRLPLTAWCVKYAVRASAPWHLAAAVPGQPDRSRWAVCGATMTLEQLEEPQPVNCLSEIGCEACRRIAHTKYRELRRQFLARVIEPQKNTFLDTVLGHVFPGADENQEVNGGDLLENLTIALDAFSPGVLLCGRDVRTNLGACDAE